MDKKVLPFLGYDFMGKEEFKSIFDDMLSSGGLKICEVNNEVAGFFSVTRRPGRCTHVAYIGTLAIKPIYQGKGIAKQLMQYVISDLLNDDVKRIELIVESDNPKAIKFYEKLGFKIEGTLRKFYKRLDDDKYIDDFIMSYISE